MDALETTAQWKRLLDIVAPLSLKREFETNLNRVADMSLEVGDLYIDYSKQLLDEQALECLLDVAEVRQVIGKFHEMANGARVNFTEGRAVGHMALRAPADRQFMIDGRDVSIDVHRVLKQMTTFANNVRRGVHVGATGRCITTVINIGIGGSDLGPVMAYEALRTYRSAVISCRFVANVDPADLTATLVGLDPAETLFIIASKTFTTAETLANAQAARAWLVDGLGQDAVEKHFVAVSSNAAAVGDFGIDTKNMFEFWEWVGGRYSLPSAIGLSVMLAVGPEVFAEFLEGMYEMDSHVLQTQGRNNAPLMMALVNVWNSAKLGYPSRAIIPYAFDLRRFPAYLQQLIMESNGKSVRRDGTAVPYPTSPIIWGEPGTNGQHAFMQLLHQGTAVVPVDFIGFAQSAGGEVERTALLFTNMLAQSQALAFGGGPESADSSAYRQHRVFTGNRPSTTIVSTSLTPGVLGQLIALYEHTVFFEGVLWDIDSFDQWGVELGKILAQSLGSIVDTGSLPKENTVAFLPNIDDSTHTLMTWFAQHRTNRSGTKK